MKIFGFLMLLVISKIVFANTIAIVPFKGELKTFDKDLIANLKQKFRYELIEQEKIEEIYNELQKGQTGLVNQEDAAKLGYLKGINYFIFGETSRSGSDYVVNYRIVHTQTGSIIGAGRDKGYEKILTNITEMISNQLDIYLNLQNPESPYTVLLKTNKEKPIFKVGEKLEIMFKVISHKKDASKKVYIQLFSIDAKGNMSLIYPNKYSGFDPIEIDKEYKFPSEKEDFEWILTEPIGTEYIQAFVSPNPLNLFNANSIATREDFPEISKKGNDLSTTRAIQTQLKKDKIKDWSSMRISYELIE